MAERTQDTNPGGGDAEDEGSDQPSVPEGVLRGIEDVYEGETASKEDIEDVLKF